MAETVRIDPQAHAKLSELAKLTSASMTETLTKALAAYERELFFAQLAEGYAARTAEERAEDERELAVWDATLSDGLADL